MKYVRFAAWLVAVISTMWLIGGSMHHLYDMVMPALGLSGNQVTAGGYTMEVVISAMAFVMIMWRLLWALEVIENVKEAIQLFMTRTGMLSLGLAGLVGMGFVNRLFWWFKHMFTDQAFDYDPADYTGGANSALVTLLLCVIVYALHASSDHEVDKRASLMPKGLSVAVIFWLIAWVAFVTGIGMYHI